MAELSADTIIGAGVELKGSLHNHGPIHIHGHVNGEITCENQVVIGESAVITGPITAKQVDVSGQVHGNIVAENLIELQPKSLVRGDLKTTRLSIKPGATFIGRSQMAGDEEALVLAQPEAPLHNQYEHSFEEPEEKPLPHSEKRRPRLEVQ